MPPTQREFDWHFVATNPATLTFNESGMIELIIDNRTVCLAFVGNTYFAFQARCPHAGAPLQDGYIDGKGNVVCPLHHYKFCLSNGKNCTGQGYDMRVYPLEQRPNGLYIGFRK
jgi:nitrite reductase/ring-hydroxylating ferredoxin subunit